MAEAKPKILESVSEKTESILERTKTASAERAKPLLEKYGFQQEMFEEVRGQQVPTAFPQALRRYRLVYESYQTSIEEHYFWILNYLEEGWGYPNFYKISDYLAAAENSAFFGVNQQRIGLQQEKVSQFLATIGKMVKELFQLVRELRIIDERLSLYNAAEKKDESAEVSLKGFWIDLVEGGSKNPASVYGMARDLGFVTLPDLFFSAPSGMNADDVDKYVDALDFNRKVKEVLRRKLKVFLEWKRHTFEELKTRRKFTLKYLRQHYSIIKMYMSWLKPYLKNIRRLQLKDYTTSPHLIAAFEGSIIEIEILATKKKPESKYNSCILVHFYYRTVPQMNYTSEGYQRGPLHVGRLEMNFRGYAWTDNQVKNYLRYKDEEEFELLKELDATVKAAYEALGDELMKYLEESGEEFEKKTEIKKEEKKEGIIEPFVSVFGGFKDIFTSIIGKRPGEKKKEKDDPYKLQLQMDDAASAIKFETFIVYNNYKKAHKMLGW